MTGKKTVKLTFENEMRYDGYEYEKGKTYDVVDDIPGFINRCKKRGAVLCEDKDF